MTQHIDCRIRIHVGQAARLFLPCLPQRQAGRLPPRPRGGVVLAVVIVVLVIVGVLAMGLTQLLLARHRLQTAQQRHLQAVELARAGTQRAAAQLSRSPEYSGETWTIPAHALAGDEDAVVVIELEIVEGSPATRRVSSRATWGAGRDGVRYTHEILVDLKD